MHYMQEQLQQRQTNIINANKNAKHVKNPDNVNQSQNSKKQETPIYGFWKY